MVVCGIPAQTPTTMTAGRAVVTSPRRLKSPSSPTPLAHSLRGPEFGLSISRHMMATTTGGIAHGTNASVLASHPSLRSWSSSSASPIAATNCRIVTEKAQTIPILNEFQNSSLESSVWKFSVPVKVVTRLSPARESVKPR